jgi:hypothetical protein
LKTVPGRWFPKARGVPPFTAEEPSKQGIKTRLSKAIIRHPQPNNSRIKLEELHLKTVKKASG